jgi:hypothetical protein
MQKLKMKYKQNKSPCGKCGIEGIESPVELLPKGGILMRAVHDDGTVHKWAEYSSMYLGRERKTEGENVIYCPKCAAEGKNKKGMVNAYHPDIANHPEQIEYQILHEKIKGTWGKHNKRQRRNRCYITDKDQRDIILKKLGRYIEQPKL